MVNSTFTTGKDTKKDLSVPVFVLENKAQVYFHNMLFHNISDTIFFNFAVNATIDIRDTIFDGIGKALSPIF